MSAKKTPAEAFSNLWVRDATRLEVDWMIKKHYLHKWAGVVLKVFGLEQDGVCVGVCTYSLPAFQMNTRYGCKCCWELSRLWIDDKMPCNTESWFISKTIALIRKEHPEVEALVSFADPEAGHVGTIYKAANWVMEGVQDEERKSPRVDLYIGEKKFARFDRAFRAADAQGLPRAEIGRAHV